MRGKHGLSMTEGISMSSSAHWRREVNKDSSLQFHMIFNPFTMNVDFTLYRFHSTWEEREVVSKFPIPHSSVVHMFSNTKNYAVVVLYPVAVDFWSMLQHNMHPFESLKKLDEPTRFYLINLHNGSVIDGFQTNEPALIFSAHHVNAWEEDGEVVLDLTCNHWDAMATFMDIHRMMNQSLSNKNKADNEMKRVRLRTADKSVKVEDWPNARGIPMLNTFDFPMINNNYNGKKNRYVYGWVSIDYWRQTLVKKDLENSMNDKMWSQNSHYPGEVFFIPRPGAEAEDDGVLVTVVFDGKKKSSYLLLLDGQTFTEVNRSYLPFKVPFSFHGNWFPELY